MTSGNGGGTSVLAARLRPPRTSAIVRDRLERVLDDIEEVGIGLVVAPAGSGKTTLLARAVERFDGSTAWLRVDTSDSAPERLLATLRAALGLKQEVGNIDELVAKLDESSDGLLVVVDDIHTLDDESLGMLERLALHRPIHVTLVFGSRTAALIERTELQSPGSTVVVDAETLRFRLWEAESLFREHYRDRLPPEDIARLNRLSGGWAAALHMFHSATADRGLAARRRILDNLRGRTHLTDDYLARHVVDALPQPVANFFCGAALLGTLSAAVCDEFLDCTDSRLHLADLEQRGLITRLDDDTSFSCHEVLRGHLEARAIEGRPTAETAERFVAAGRLQAEAGHHADALRAFARGGDFIAAHQLLLRSGAALDGATASLESLPATLREDPWLLLAEARARAADGDLWSAIGLHRRAVEHGGESAPAATANREMRDLSLWTESDPPGRPTASGYLRQATIARPRGIAATCEDQPTTDEGLAGIAARLLAGDRRGASRDLTRLLRRRDLDDRSANQARALELAIDILGPDGLGAGEVDRVADLADKLGCTRDGRLIRAVEALSGDPAAIGRAAEIVERSDAVGDLWGAALAALMANLGALRNTNDPRHATESCWHYLDAETRFDQLGAPVLALWAEATKLVAIGHPSLDELRSLEARAREIDVPGVRALALSALATLDRRVADPLTSLLRELDLDGWRVSSAVSSRAVDISCFGQFRVRVASSELPLGDLRPRARELLRLLALHDGAPVAAETIGEHLWPDGDPQRAKRNLQVGVSAIRRWFAVAGAEDAVLYDDDAYRLNPELVSTDIARLEAAVAAAENLADSGDNERGAAGWTSALRIADGPLLADDQRAEWFTEPARLLREQIVNAAASAAALHLAAHHFDAAVQACESGLMHDPYRDALWRLRIEAFEMAGDPALAARAQKEYEAVLTDLGIS